VEAARTLEVEQAVEYLKARSDKRDKSEIEEGSVSLLQIEGVEEILSEKRLQPEDKSPDALYKEMESAWEDLNKVLGAKLRSIGKTFDARYSLGTSVAPLTDALSHPLSKSDVEFIANLHGQYRRFYGLQSTKEQWLTPDVYSTFIAGVARAKKLITQTG
jgi:hypothetical protein